MWLTCPTVERDEPRSTKPCLFGLLKPLLCLFCHLIKNECGLVEREGRWKGLLAGYFRTISVSASRAISFKLIYRDLFLSH